MGENKHSRQITEGDGVSDEVAVLWSDLEDSRRRWGAHGAHRKPE